MKKTWFFSLIAISFKHNSFKDQSFTQRTNSYTNQRVMVVHGLCVRSLIFISLRDMPFYSKRQGNDVNTEFSVTLIGVGSV